MSDRCYTQKKINKLLIDYRNTILPKVKSNWELLSESVPADWSIVFDYLFLTFLMNGAYIQFLPYIWKHTSIQFLKMIESGFAAAKSHHFNI